jgi:hypothetical protein
MPVRTKAKSQAQNVKSTPKKSKYFKRQATSDSDEDEDHDESGYEDDNAVVTPTSAEPEGEHGSEDSSEEDRKPKMRRGTTGRKATLKAKLPTSRELLKEGVKTGLGPGKEVRIKLPKAREAGGIPYQDDKIHPNTFLFLKDLAQNNDRDWLKCKTRPHRSIGGRAPGLEV